MTGMAAVFVSNEIFSNAFAGCQAVFDPRIFVHCTIENRLQVLHTAARKMLRFSDYTNAYEVIVLRNMPEPTFVRHIGNRSRPLVNTRLAFGALKVSPDGNFVEKWVG